MKQMKTKLDVALDIKSVIKTYMGTSVICEWYIVLYDVLSRQQRVNEAEMIKVKILNFLSKHGGDEDNGFVDIQDRSPNIQQEFKESDSKSPFVYNASDSIKRSTTRGRAWQLLFGLTAVDTNNYINQIQKDESKQYLQTCLDSCRICTFRSRVPEQEVIRALNAWVHRTNGCYFPGMHYFFGVYVVISFNIDAFSVDRTSHNQTI